MDTYHWDVLVTYHWDVVGCFIWDLFETSWRRNDRALLLRPFEMSLWRSNKTPWKCTTETSWRRSIETSLSVSFETYLRRRWDVQRDVAATSPQRLNAGWAASLCNLNYLQISVKGKWLNSEKQISIDLLRSSFCYVA